MLLALRLLSIVLRLPRKQWIYHPVRAASLSLQLHLDGVCRIKWGRRVHVCLFFGGFYRVIAGLFLARIDSVRLLPFSSVWRAARW